MDNFKKDIEKAISMGDPELISDAIFELDMKHVMGEPLSDEEVGWIIKTIDDVMKKDARGSNTLVNLFQSHWSKMSELSQRKVKSLCERHVDNYTDLGTQTAMCEILNGEYLR